MSVLGIFWLVILGLVIYALLTYLAIKITMNRTDDTPFWEPLILSILLTPIITIMLEMLKPYDAKR